ncbi:MAG: cobyrinate a,c-diamide synthase [Thermodesulforhabdaceae bacterium]
MEKLRQQKCFPGVLNPAGLVVAALKGGSGKTFVSTGLAAAFKSIGYKVVPFKKGPDYIDAGWLSVAAGSPCYNLDMFLMKPEDVVASFCYQSNKADIALVEGNRGLFDGLDEIGSCSTAELAKLLGLPVVLIIDVTKMTRTSAALVYGCQHFDKDLKVSGVILNRVGTSRQETLIRRAIEESCGVPVVGSIPRLSNNFFPERHLGLIPAFEHFKVREAIDYARNIVKDSVDLEKVLSIAEKGRSCGLGFVDFSLSFDSRSAKELGCVIGVIRDEAFQFYYPENLLALEKAGAKLVFFSALADKHLPSNIDGLYIGGGFPEVYAEILAGNDVLKAEIREAIDRGLPVYAECGGLMYLSEYITVDKSSYPMVGVLPLEVEMYKRPQGHGYVLGQIVEENPFFPVGYSFRGHEFHYSRAVLKNDSYRDVRFILKLQKGHGIVEQFDGIVYRNCVALYAHVHALTCKEWAKSFVKTAQSYRVGNMKSGSFKEALLPAVDDQL